MIRGTPVAEDRSMPDVQVTRAPLSAFNDIPEKKVGLAVGLAIVLVAGGLIWWVPQHSTGASENTSESTLPLETFVVNLVGSSPRAYLRIGITLGLAHSISNRNEAQPAPIAEVRDTILSVLATARPEDLLQSEGKRRLKIELLKTLQEHVPQLSVQHICFTEFLVQM